MVIVEPWPYPTYPTYPNYPTPWYPDTDPDSTPIYPPAYPKDLIHPKEVKERHVKDVKKGIMIKFDDGTWMFIATDDECYQKIKEALKDE